MSDPLAVESATTSKAPGERPNGGHAITVVVKVALQAIALPEADGGYSVVVPALPGCVTQGDTIEEVQANIVEAAEGWLESQHDALKDEALKVMTS
jgi:predicted RNase H-like HicB family nuclease